MQFQTLNEFLVLARTMNFLAAAEELYVSQATLSKHIKDLEKELGASLFRRTTRRVELTELGILMIPYAQKATKLYESIRQDADTYVERMNNHLTVGCVSHWDQIDLGRLAIDFQQDNPGVHITLTTNDTEHLLQLLAEEKCQFAIVREAHGTVQEGFSRIHLCDSPFVAIVPESNPLAQEKSLSVEQLKDELFLMESPGSLAYNMCIQACHDAGFHPNIIYSGGGPQISNYMSHGIGITLGFERPMDFPGRVPVVQIPLDPEIHADINLVFISDSLTDSGNTFLRFIKQYSF